MGRILGRALEAPKNKPLEDTAMHLTVAVAPVVALIAGILILVMPRLLNFIVAIYLIIIGLIGLFGTGGGMHI